MRYEPEAPGDEYLDRYVHNTDQDNDYFDFGHIYDFEDDMKSTGEMFAGWGVVFDETDINPQIKKEEENDEDFDEEGEGDEGEENINEEL